MVQEPALDGGRDRWREVGWSARLGDELTEELVLAPFQIPDQGEEPAAGAQGGVGMALGAGVFMAGQRCLGDERPDPGVVGIVGEDQELLVENGELLAGPDQPVMDVAERPFDD